METNIPPSSSEEKSEGKVSGCDVGVGQSPAAPGRGQGSKAAHGEHKGKKGGPKRSAQGDKVLTTKSKPAPQDKQANTKPSLLNDKAKVKPSAQNEQPVATSSTNQAKATPTPPDHQAKSTPTPPDHQTKVIPPSSDDQAKTTPTSNDQAKVTPTPPADQVKIKSGVGDKSKEEPSTAPGGALKREPSTAPGGALKREPSTAPGGALKRELLKVDKAGTKAKSPAAHSRVKAEIGEQSYPAESRDNSEEEEGDGEEEAQGTRRPRTYQCKFVMFTS